MMAASLQEKWPDRLVEGRRDFPIALARLASPRPTYSSADQDIAPLEYRFGTWRLVPGARLLLRDGQPVELGSRAFDLLHLLLSWRGMVVEKRMILGFVWPNTIVEESNLRFQMAALRKALGRQRDLIKTIPGRGYIFAAAYEIA